jgi:hypothetical protein
MKYGLNEAVARYIVYAQMASDAGKHTYCLQDMFTNKAMAYSLCEDRYWDKDQYIRRAIDIIIRSKSHPTGFTFYVTKSEITSYLVYFTFKLHGKRYQISYHSYDPWLGRFKDSNPKIKIRWDRESSRDNCRYLYNELFLN